jgi:prepilin-type N-terminal cleavage/methylation domain-containing protein
MEGGEIKMQILRAKNKSLGFTLIELLVVIAIIGILAAVVLVSLNSARAKSRDARRISDMHQIQTALELYYNDCGVYPTSLATATANGCTGATTFGTFLAAIPTNPSGCTNAGGSAPAGSATAYGYSPLTTALIPTDYTVFFCTEGAVAPTITAAASGHTAKPGGITQ